MKPKLTQNKLTTGASWLIIANVSSRLIGIAYVIPWTILFGIASINANALFGKGYTIYQFFLALSTVGLPSAVTQMANSLSRNEKSSFLISSVHFSMIQGLCTSAVLWISSPLLSNGDNNLIPVLHSLAISVIIFPFLSVIRGYFQSRLEMDVVAKSEIIEQVIRVLYMLISTYIILNVLKKGWVLAVVHSTFAAAIGALAATIYLLFKLLFIFNLKDIKSSYKSYHPFNMLVIIKKSIPFVFIGSFLTVYQWIDQYTFFYFMKIFHSGYSSHSLNVLFGVFNFNVNKLILIIVALAVSIASTILPLITANITDITLVRIKVKQAIILFWSVVLPAALGLYAVSGPIYTAFYGNYINTNITIPMTQISAIASIFMGGATVLAMIMQSLLKTKLILYYFTLGFVVKLILQPILINALGAIGPMYASLGSLVLVNYMMLRYLNHRMSISDILGDKYMGIITMTSFGMFIIVVALNSTLAGFFDNTARFTQMMVLISDVGVGMVFIAFCYYKLGVLKHLFK